MNHKSLDALNSGSKPELPAAAGPLRLLPAAAGVRNHESGECYLVPILVADIPREALE